MSDDPDSFTPPTTGSRRVSAVVALPVILACAVVGSIIGVTHPLNSFFPGEPPREEVADLRLAALKVVEPAPAEAQQKPAPEQPAAVASVEQQPEQPEVVTAAKVAAHAQGPAPSAVVSVSTGSVDRSPSPGTSGDAAPPPLDRTEVTRSDAATRVIAHNHRIARAKRLRRLVGRRARPRPPGSEVDAFFSSIFPKK